MSSLEERLASFAATHGFRGRGPLSVALVVTEHARRTGLPLDPDKLVTEGGGQVLGLGKAAVQTILKRHGIMRVLAAEGGRTSRGSLGNMRDYVLFLNEARSGSDFDLDRIESFWVTCVHQFFAAKPFKVKMDPSRSLRMIVRDVVSEAVDRQRSTPGMHYAGAVIQHLVGAKLDCALGIGALKHHSFSTADEPGARAGDFVLGDVAIHVTTSPGEAVISRCNDNLGAGLRPILVTLRDGLAVAEGLAKNVDLDDRIDFFEIEQFIALNVYELGKFALTGHKVVISKLVDRYNEIVSEVETDPSLRIDLSR